MRPPAGAEGAVGPPQGRATTRGGAPHAGAPPPAAVGPPRPSSDHDTVRAWEGHIGRARPEGGARQNCGCRARPSTARRPPLARRHQLPSRAAIESLHGRDKAAVRARRSRPRPATARRRASARPPPPLFSIDRVCAPSPPPCGASRGGGAAAAGAPPAPTPPPRADDPPPSRSGHVSGLAPDAHEADLEAVFGRVGDGCVESVAIVRGANGVAKGFGFVNFVDAAAAADAIERHNGVHPPRGGGQTWRVAPARGDGGAGAGAAAARGRAAHAERLAGANLYIKHLPLTMGEGGLRALFEVSNRGRGGGRGAGRSAHTQPTHPASLPSPTA